MDEATKHTLRTAIVIAIALLIVFTLSTELYRHAMPAEDCSTPYDYPICKRAQDPAADPPASTNTLYVSGIIMLILAVIFISVSYDASVTHQANLISAGTTANMQREAEKKDERPAVKEAESKKMVERTSQSAVGTQKSTTAVVDKKILPPQEKPKMGVNENTKQRLGGDR